MDAENELCRPDCAHDIYHIMARLGDFNERSVCCLIDTGAQVCLISKSIINEMRDGAIKVEMRPCRDSLHGLGNNKERVMGFVELSLKLNGLKAEVTPFAVVEDGSIPCCVILGANFILNNKITIDFSKDMLVMNSSCELESYLINTAYLNRHIGYRYDVMEYFGLVSVEEKNGVVEDEVSGQLRYIIPKEELIQMQARNDAIKQLKRVIRDNIPCRLWKHKSILQFRRSASSLEVKDELLVKVDGVFELVVVSVPFLVEVIARTHEKLNHVGRQKLINAIQGHFWHPAIYKVSGDICRSCKFCQLWKTSRQDLVPPTIQIQSKYPFQLSAVDLLQLQKTSRGNVALLVFVDHYSKWVSAIPIRDKRGITVSNALKSKILPYVPKIPEQILSDNGPEFVSSEFCKVLEDYNISHVFSSPYHAPGNGACERVNRTLIQMLKFANKDEDWDLNINEVIINYNNTYHSKIQMSPSKFLLFKAHDTRERLPLHSEVIRTWKQGHPNFSSFKVGQLVLKKVNKIGNRVRYKLEPKFEGPFVVKTVFSNGLSYEILEERTGRLIKINHKYLKLWYPVPKYINKYLCLKKESEVIQSESLHKSSTVKSRHWGYISSSESEDSSESENSSDGQVNSDDDFSFSGIVSTSEMSTEDCGTGMNQNKMKNVDINNIGNDEFDYKNMPISSTPMNRNPDFQRNNPYFDFYNQTFTTIDDLMNDALCIVSAEAYIDECFNKLTNEEKRAFSDVQGNKADPNKDEFTPDTIENNGVSRMVNVEDSNNFEGFETQEYSNKQKELRSILSSVKKIVGHGSQVLNESKEMDHEKGVKRYWSEDRGSSCGSDRNAVLEEFSDTIGSIRSLKRLHKRILRSRLVYY